MKHLLAGWLALASRSAARWWLAGRSAGGRLLQWRWICRPRLVTAGVQTPNPLHHVRLRDNTCALQSAACRSTSISSRLSRPEQLRHSWIEEAVHGRSM